MRLVDHLGATDYQDLLRAVGQFCDARGWRGLQLLEHEDGLLVQYSVASAPQDFLLHLFTAEDLQTLLRQAHARRHAAKPSPETPPARVAQGTDRLVTTGVAPPSADDSVLNLVPAKDVGASPRKGPPR